MPSAWLLPEHLADVLPSQARCIEELRRQLLDTAQTYGFELVMPPLLEHLDALLSGAGRQLGLKTFKLVDQLSGRSLGVRADTTSQVARIDAHLLNRRGVTRLCYCGPVLHTLPEGPRASREPLQWGAEIYGHAGLEADLEVQELALDLLERTGVTGCVMDMGDARIVQGVLQDQVVSAPQQAQIYEALAAKDPAALRGAAQFLPSAVRQSLLLLLRLYGGPEVLVQARREFAHLPSVTQALDDLQWLSQHVRQAHPSLRIGFDLADLSGYAYYSGPRFAVYTESLGDALVRGGRYDAVGSVFGRNRPAVGFSTDLKQWVTQLTPAPARAAIRAPWGHDNALREAIRALRQQGELVVCSLPGHDHETQEFDCDRGLFLDQDRWVIRPLSSPI
jgi:ATP phosphoribosyltransferase regulatory subunit